MTTKTRRALISVLKTVALVIISLLSLALIVTSNGGRMNPLESQWGAIMILTFPYLLVVDILIMLFLLVIGRWRVAVIPFVAILLSWSMVSMVCPLNVVPHTYTPQEESTKFKVLTFNVENFEYKVSGNDSIDRVEGLKTARYILDQDADIVLLQEASLSADFNSLKILDACREEINRKYPYRDNGYHDQVIWSKHPYTCVVDDSIKNGFASPDDPLNSYHCYARAFDVQVPGHVVRFFNIHLQSLGLTQDDRDQYVKITQMKGVSNKQHLEEVGRSLMSKLSSAFEQHAKQAKIIREVISQSDENVIVCGDFNDVPGSFAYRTICGNDLNDSWVDCGFGMANTYHKSRLFFKIDHMFYRGDMMAVEAHRDRAGASDHYPLVTTFVWKKKIGDD